MLESSREYECINCGYRFILTADLDQQGDINMPKYCPSKGRGKKKKCKSTQFNYVEGSHICRDIQRIKIQEQVQKLGMGSIPRSILVILTDDLVDICKAGDDIEIIGIVRRMWQPLQKENRCEIEIYLEANYILVKQDTKSTVQVTEEAREIYIKFWKQNKNQPLFARNYLISRICPQLYGMFLVKLAVALTIIGGVPHVCREERKKIHIYIHFHLSFIHRPPFPISDS